MKDHMASPRSKTVAKDENGVRQVKQIFLISLLLWSFVPYPANKVNHWFSDWVTFWTHFISLPSSAKLQPLSLCLDRASSINLKYWTWSTSSKLSLGASQRWHMLAIGKTVFRCNGSKPWVTDRPFNLAFDCSHCYVVVVQINHWTNTRDLTMTLRVPMAVLLKMCRVNNRWVLTVNYETYYVLCLFLLFWFLCLERVKRRVLSFTWFGKNVNDVFLAESDNVSVCWLLYVQDTVEQCYLKKVLAATHYRLQSTCGYLT